MTRRERLMKTLRGGNVDRPPVSFYELNGLDEDPNDDDPFNIYSHPSWKPLIELTRQETDRIVMRGVPYTSEGPDPVDERTETETFMEDGSRYTIQRLQAGGRTLTTRQRRDPDVNTVWTEEHLLKNVDDLKAYLTIPEPPTEGIVDPTPVLQAEEQLGETGIVMIDTPDPLCLAADMFKMSEYTIIAMTEQNLFHQLLKRFTKRLWAKTVAVAEALPGRLWRIFGPEYATPPYLPPNLFDEYVGRYVAPMIEAIQQHGGYARIHSHGNLRDVLDSIVGMNADGLDPIEPPPQGDVELSYVRENYGEDMVLFGNLEVADIENMPTDKFADKIAKALNEGTSGTGRGFVLMPSACPYGRKLSSLALNNYNKMVEMTANF